jgi:hypothetical protein
MRRRAKEVIAYIKHLQATSPVWNAATWNCVAFIQAIASHMGLRVPGNHLLYPEDWVNRLRELNGGRRYMASQPVGAGSGSTPGLRRLPARKPAAPARQIVEPLRAPDLAPASNTKVDDSGGL